MSDSLQPHRLYSPWNSQTRILEWVAFPFSRGSSQLRDRTQVSCIAGDSLPAEPIVRCSQTENKQNENPGESSLIWKILAFSDLFLMVFSLAMVRIVMVLIVACTEFLTFSFFYIKSFFPRVNNLSWRSSATNVYLPCSLFFLTAV